MELKTRKDLKQAIQHDVFKDRVELSLEYAAEHRRQMIRYGIAVLVLVVAVIGIWSYLDHQQDVRQRDLSDALRLQNALVGQTDQQNAFVQTFATQADKDKAVSKALTEVADKYPSKREGLIARFFMGSQDSDAGRVKQAEQNWKQVADSGEKDLASQAKLSLAQLYESQGRNQEAEKLLRDLMANPTIMVSKEQAQISLGRLLEKTNPAEARKLLEPLRTDRAAVSRVAINALSEMPQQPQR